MNSFPLKIASLGILLALITGCEKKNLEQQPVKLVWDRETCEQCAMAVSDRRYAVQVIEPNGKAHFFDDIGCALTWLENQEWGKGSRTWVSDVNTNEWIDAEKANWRFGDPNTPMGYGFAATLNPVENALEFDTVQQMIADNRSLRHHHQAKHRYTW